MFQVLYKVQQVWQMPATQKFELIHHLNIFSLKSVQEQVHTWWSVCSDQLLRCSRVNSEHQLFSSITQPSFLLQRDLLCCTGRHRQGGWGQPCRQPDWSRKRAGTGAFIKVAPRAQTQERITRPQGGWCGPSLLKNHKYIPLHPDISTVCVSKNIYTHIHLCQNIDFSLFVLPYTLFIT